MFKNKGMRLKVLLFITYSFLLINSMFAQGIITGKVTDENGEPLPGANVVLKGTSQGAVTDVNGEYSISLQREGAVLIFSYIGYIIEEIEVGSRTVINTMLTPDISKMEEIVVIGYGSREKKDVTTSIASIDSKDISKNLTMNPEMAMQGTMAGVQVSGNNGNPFNRPTIRIRGTNTWGNAQPLYVIDGIPITEAGSGAIGQNNARFQDVRGPLNIMTLIDPNDIESISVLKDASAGAIYGVRASNGVILITTKSGKKGEKMKLNLSSRFGVQNMNRRHDVLNTQQYTEYLQTIRDSDPTFSIPPESEGTFIPGSPNYLGNNPTHNWQDVVLRDNATIQDHSLSLTGGSEKTDYKVSFNYAKNNGVTISNYLERISGSVAMNTQVTDWMKIGLNYRQSMSEGSDRSFNDNIHVNRAALTPPWQPILDANGPRGYAPVIGGRLSDGTWSNTKLYGAGTRGNGPGQMALSSDIYESQRSIGSAHLQIEPIRNLRVTGRVSFDNFNTTRYEWRDYEGNVFTFAAGDPSAVGGGSSLGSYGIRDNYNTNFMKEITIEYDKSFGDHNLNFLLGVSQQNWEGGYQYANSTFMNSTAKQLRNIPTNTENEHTSAGSETMIRDALVGQIFRIGYNYQSTFYFDGTVRRDGSTRFPSEERWGIFPSFSTAYRLTNQPFMTATRTWLNDLKIRAGWGQLGNFDVADLAYLSKINEGPAYAWGNLGNGLGNLIPGATVFSLPNRGLEWERTTTINIGIDAFLFNALNLTFEYYDKTTSDLLQVIALPGSAGVSEQPSANVGTVKNSGFELALNYEKSLGEFVFSIGGNITTVKNRVTKLYNGIPLYDGTNLEEGLPIGFLRGYQVAGMFQTENEVDEWLEKYTDVNYQVDRISPGDLYFKNTGSAPTDSESFRSTELDTLINTFDQVQIGNVIPRYYYGLNLGANFKGFDLSVNFVGVGDVQKYNSNLVDLMYTSGYGGNLSTDILNSWTPTNTNTDIPRIIANDPAGNLRRSDRFVENASYFRLTNMQIGYSLPNIEKLGVTNARIYLGGSNLFTITNFSGLDPEESTYPTPVTWYTGINITF